MANKIPFLIGVILLMVTTQKGICQAVVAKTPPMGWNSYYCFGAQVTEADVRANADYMEEHLKQFGWEYVVIDFLWYVKDLTVENWQYNDSIIIDHYGRMRPRADYFPSSAADSSFKSLADYIHAKGLKFGVHLMRGIPKIAVLKNLPIKGTNYRAQDISSTENLTPWYQEMYSVEMSQPGAQEYYNSLVELYASWGVDFIKIDGIADNPYRPDEIEGYYNAVKNCNRAIVISLSPGPSHLSEAGTYIAYSNMWRMRNDSWDHWSVIPDMMSIAESWNQYRNTGHWPDADMLPLGKISIRSEATYLPNQVERYCRLTEDEQYTMMTFWTIFRSPLIFGGHLPDNDQFTFDLITNPEVIYINQKSENNTQLFYKNNTRAWAADDPESGDKFLALFNLNSSAKTITVTWSQLGISGDHNVKDIWSQTDLGIFNSQLSRSINVHGTGLYRISAITATGDGSKAINKIPTVDVQLYPVPATDGMLSVELSGFENPSFKIFDLHGRIMAEHNSMESIFEISTEEFQKDLYIISVVDRKNTLNRKLIIQ